MPTADNSRMTRARQILPGTTYLVTRRVSQRQFLLKPTAESVQVMLYCIHRAAQMYNIDIHSVQVPDNHAHITLTDRDGRLPEFMAWLDREVAKCMNKLYKRSENFWCTGSYSAVRLLDDEAVFDKTGYLFVNVVQALLVRDFRDWRGVRSTPEDWMKPPTLVKRPDFHFNQNDERWAEVECRYSVPPQFRDRNVEDFVREVNANIKTRQGQIVAEAKRNGKAFIGVDRLAKLNPFDKPKSKARKGKLNPRFAAGTAEGQRLGRNMLKAFHVGYCEALGKWRNGQASMFPAGTYWLAKFVNVCCAPLSTATPALSSA
jgi:REP element-mobilizing transposase RayT